MRFRLRNGGGNMAGKRHLEDLFIPDSSPVDTPHSCFMWTKQRQEVAGWLRNENKTSIRGL
jgi:hypothetical protein